MRTLFLLVLALLSVGCTHYEPLALHGAGSMRVEVEVYKGPLTVPVTGQVGQLVAVLSDSIHAASDWHEQALAEGIDLRCEQFAMGAKSRGRFAGTMESRPGDRRDCQILSSTYESSEDMLQAACYIVDSPTLRETVGLAVYIPVTTCGTSYAAPRHLDRYRLQLDLEINRCKQSTIAETLHCQGEVIAIAFDNIATLMRSAAFRATDANVRSVPRHREVRGLVTAFGYLSSEYGNQLQARITVLQKQLAEAVTASAPREARTLPVSDYLRDAGRTDFIQLFDWLNATTDGGVGAGRAGKLDPQERIRMAQRLTADYYWQKVNEVYASGQGDVSMAFIKDDLGNWDLKSFSNDPQELLASYRKVTDAALKTTAKLAQKLASGGSLDALEGAASFANQFAGGNVSAQAGATVGGLDVGALHRRAAARLATDRLTFQARSAALEIEIQNLKAASANDPAAQAADITLQAAVARRSELTKDAVASARRTLDDHLAVIAALQAGVGGGGTAVR